jgi:O-antigen ligase
MKRAGVLPIYGNAAGAVAGTASASSRASQPPALRASARDAVDRPFLFWALLGYFFLEYVRPPGIVNLRLQSVILVLLAVCWILEPRRPWSRALTLQTGFLALSALSVFYALNSFAAYIAARQMFGNAVIALSVSWLMSRRRNFVLGVWFWVLMMSYQAQFAVLHGGVGTGGFIGDENDVALGCCVALSFALPGAIFLRGWRRIASGALALLFTTAIVVSFSRGGFVGLVALVIYGVLVSPHRIRALAILAAGVLVFYLSVPPTYKTEVASIFENKEHDTGEARVFLWRTAWTMYLDHPVLGVGVGNFNWNTGRYQLKATTGRFASREYIERDWTMAAVHSFYFTILSETGTVGSLLVIGIIYGHFAAIRRTRRLVARHPAAGPRVRREATLYGVGLSMAMVGFLTAGAFLSVAYYPWLWMLSGLSIAWERTTLAEIANDEAPDRPLEASKDGQA